MSGAGKSTVCKVFAENGFSVIDCDLSAREVVLPGSPALTELSERLSPQLIRSDGTLDRRMTSEMIFHNDEKRALFNKIIYPYITYNISEKVRCSSKFALLDAPTLYEARLDFMCDSIVSVIADIEKCVERITTRDHIPIELARARLSSQHDATFYQTHSMYCIENNGTEQELRIIAERISRELINKSKGNK